MTMITLLLVPPLPPCCCGAAAVLPLSLLLLLLTGARVRPFRRVLVPDLALAAKLSARVELEEGGGEEVEIRAATVYIADRIVQRLPGVLGALGAIGGVVWHGCGCQRRPS